MNEQTFSVPDIHCDHCKTSLEGAVGGLEGVATVEVDVPQATVAVAFDETRVGRSVIVETIEEQGYEVAS